MKIGMHLGDLALCRRTPAGLRIREQLLVFLLFLAPSFAEAQNRISGRVVDAETGEGLPSANVFFAGTLIGNSTNKDGWFAITGFGSGKYEFTVSYVGYAMYRQSYTFTGSEQVGLLIKLTPDPQELAAIVVTPNDRDRKANYQLFKKLFLGEGGFAKQCDILNPDDLYVYRDPNEGVLVAHCAKPLIVENRALGYRIQYHLILFQYAFLGGRLDVYGIPQFEEMKPKDENKKADWEKNRRVAYLGSVTHFMRSLTTNRLPEEHFIAARVVQVPNRERPPQEYLDRKIDSLKTVQKGPNPKPDIVRSELFQLGMKRAMPLTVDSILNESVQGRELLNPDTLNQVRYTGSLVVEYGEQLSRTPEGKVRIRNGQYSRLFVYNPFQIYENGFFDNLGNLVVEGDWANSEKLPQMLPMEYRVEGER